jgi:hypothetical protein
LQKVFDNILDFTQIKETCLFCQQQLRPFLTNFTGFHKISLAILNASIASNRFSFPISHTTESYDIHANAAIDIVKNKLIITGSAGSPMSLLDQYVAKQALDDLRPYIQLTCHNKHCKYEYYLSSSILRIGMGNLMHNTNNGWTIEPIKLCYETFQTHNLVIQNDWSKEETLIYSINNEEAIPIKVIPIIDFNELGSEKLLQRIQTYVIYS